ncbi:glycoside hydrolase family 95-like protein [Streptomyces sp. NPDC005322]|uniref:glycoside hydrolase family 95-like protein n=1 Tax=unclassified Streptomyces TaxID=2593676 RepID=UPI0033B4643F
MHDARMQWSRLPEDWRTAPFLGNGPLTVQVHGAPGGSALRFSLAGAGLAASVAPHLDLVPTGAITGLRCELDLWNAELTGTLTTTRGQIAFAALVPHHREVLLLRTLAEEGERGASFTPLPANRIDASVTWVQGRKDRGGAWLAAALGTTDSGELRRILADGAREVIAEHRCWWHGFYPSSYVSLPDKTLQRFHWIQMYALGSLTDPTARAVRHTPAPLGTANHLALGPVAAALTDGLEPSHDHLVGALPGVGSKGGRAENPVLAAGAPALWDAYRRIGDERILRELLHPALRSAVTFHAGFLVEGADGLLHMPLTHATGHGDMTDCTHDLSLLRWATTHLIAATRRLGLHEPHLPRWQDIAARLTPYHHDAGGVLIGAGVRAARSDPRPGHLLWMLPLREKVWSRPDDRPLMRSSFDHWASMRDAWDSGSYVAAAGLAAALRDAAQAHDFLTRLTASHTADDSALLGNTLHRHASTLRAAAPFDGEQALLDLLVGGDDGVVEAFPAVPDSWRDISVAGLRVPGAFVLDASRRQGRTEWVRVHSESGGSLTLRHGMDADTEVRISGPGDEGPGRLARARRTAPGVCAVPLRAGESATFVRRGLDPAVEPREVPGNGGARRWG